jgi:hypothetical protein
LFAENLNKAFVGFMVPESKLGALFGGVSGGVKVGEESGECEVARK